ncbi:MAG: extracellular solute-binding protein [Candidatus Limnocylindria bacterium]
MKGLQRGLAGVALLAIVLGACSGAAGPAGVGASAGAGAGAAAGLKFPDTPVTLSILDIAGQDQLVKGIFDKYKKAYPNRLRDYKIEKATSPEMPAKIKAQQDAKNVQTALVLTGLDGMAAGVEQGIWEQLLPKYASTFPDLENNYLDGAKPIQGLTKGFGIMVVYTPSGPLIEYNAAKVPNPPKTAAELLAWAKANPNKLEYARPANSGPGRTLLQGLPYVLGDKDPKDPEKGWDKTWQFLKDLDPYIEFYPTGTSPTMKSLADGTRWIIASTMGWDINPRALGQVPKDVKVAKLDNTSFVADEQFMTVPRGLDEGQLAVVLDLIAFALKPENQAFTYDAGYFYPGPAVKGSSIDMAPAESQQVIKEFGRPEYDQWAKDTKIVLPLDTKQLVTAFDLWDKAFGAKKK